MQFQNRECPRCGKDYGTGENGGFVPSLYIIDPLTNGHDPLYTCNACGKWFRGSEI